MNKLLYCLLLSDGIKLTGVRLVNERVTTDEANECEQS